MRKTLSWKWVLITSVLFALFIVFVLPQVATYSNEVIRDSASPDTSLFYSAKQLYRMTENYGPSGRAAYINLRWTFDVVWPLVYVLFLVLWIVKLSQYLSFYKATQFLFIFPIVGMVLDFLENIGATIIMYRYPLSSGVIATITPLVTFLKWITLSGSFLIIIILTFLIILTKFRKLSS